MIGLSVDALNGLVPDGFTCEFGKGEASTGDTVGGEVVGKETLLIGLDAALDDSGNTLLVQQVWQGVQSAQGDRSHELVTANRGYDSLERQHALNQHWIHCLHECYSWVV
jgi:hypothetical protein